MLVHLRNSWPLVERGCLSWAGTSHQKPYTRRRGGTIRQKAAEAPSQKKKIGGQRKCMFILQISIAVGARKSGIQKRKQLETIKKGFPGGSVVKNVPAKAEDMGSIPGLGRSPGGGHGNPLLEKPMD